MSKVKGLVCSAIGVTIITAVYHDYSTKYSSEKIWQRQKPVIEMTYQRDQKKKEEAFDLLRKSLAEDIPTASNDVRCKFEKRFETTVRHKGDVKAAEEEIQRRSFEPLSECDSSSQLSSSFVKWYTALAGVFIMVGIYNLFKKSEN